MSCKVCAEPTAYFATVDLARHCDSARVTLPATGVLVEYRRCTACGFIGTTHFDGWTFADWRARVYDELYAALDPDGEQVRPKKVADLVRDFMGAYAGRLRVLDYGGGEGRCAEELRRHGFAAEAWDPVYGVGERPARRFDLVLAVEVFEHLTQPRESFADMVRCVDGAGMVMIATLLVPADVTPDWWYLAPRNGHVSLHTAASLRILAHELGARVISGGDGGTHCVLPAGDPWFAPRAVELRHAA